MHKISSNTKGLTKTSVAAITLLIALTITLSPIVGAIPFKAVKPATSNGPVAPTLKLYYPYVIVDNNYEVRDLSVSNPEGNPSITEIDVSIPVTASVDAAYTPYISGFTPWAINFETGIGPWTQTVVAISPGYPILATGATGDIGLRFVTENWETTTGVVDVYQFTVQTFFSTGQSTTQKVSIYEGIADSTTVEVWDASSASWTTSTQVMAGQTVKCLAYAYSSWYFDTPDAGVPLLALCLSDIGVPPSSVTPVNLKTNATGYAAFTVKATDASENVGNYYVYADADNTTTAPLNWDILSGYAYGFGYGYWNYLYGPFDYLYTSFSRIWVDPDYSHPTVEVLTDQDSAVSPTITYLTTTTYMNVTLVDEYGNSIPVVYDCDAYLTAVPIVGPIGYLNTGYAEIYSGYQSTAPFWTIYYTPYWTYGSCAKIKVEVDNYFNPYTDTYSTLYGSSKELFTSLEDYSALSLNLDTYIFSSADLNYGYVMAGDYTTITLMLPTMQQGVPVTFYVYPIEPTTGYNGHFSIVHAVTNYLGIATTEFYVDTNATDHVAEVNVTLAAPLSSNPQNICSGLSTYCYPIVTIPGPVTKLLVFTYESPYTYESYTNPPQGTLSTTGPGGTLYVDVVLSDAYNNPTTVLYNTQVNLKCSLGTLSVTNAIIDYNYYGLWDSIIAPIFTAPMVTTTSTVTISATTPQQGIAGGSTSVIVYSYTPYVKIYNASGTSVQSSTLPLTTTIMGSATVSPAQPTGTFIATVMYSLDGGTYVTALITGQSDNTYNFSFSVSLNTYGTHTIRVNATDSGGYTGVLSSPWTITVQNTTVIWSITGQQTLNSTGLPQSSFVLGATVLVSATVTNAWTTSQSALIVVQVTDPRGTVLYPQYVTVTLASGQPIAPSLSFVIPTTGYSTGTWTAKIMVLTTWPAQGGVSIATPVTVAFTVTP
jgi:hypothetical protein